MGIEKYNNTAGTAEINACGEGGTYKRTSSMSSSMSSAQEAARSVDQQQFTYIH